MLNKVSSVVILTVVASGLALGQHSSSAQQTVTFGVARSHQLRHIETASSGTVAVPPGILSTLGVQNHAGGIVAKVTFSPKPQLESLQNVTHRVDGISVGASIPTGGKSDANIQQIQTDVRAIVQSSGSLLLSAESVVITITD